MTINMYSASVPVMIRYMKNMTVILDKAAAYCAAKKVDEKVLTSYRLAPDMFPLARQVQIMSDGAKGCGARLAGVDVPSFPDTEVTIEELKARIAKTISFLEGLKQAQFEGSETRDITLKAGPRELHFKGLDYLTNFVIPNFYFHASIMYAILRHAGVEIGKWDYLGAN